MLPNWVHSVILALISARTLLLVMTQTNLFFCACYAERGAFFISSPTLKAVRTHIGKSPACLAASMGVKETELETL